MTEEEKKARVRTYIEQVWNERRLDLLAKYIAEDVVLHSSPVAVGRETLRQRITAFHNGFPDLFQKVEDEMATGDRVVVRWTASGTHGGEFLGLAATGKEIATSGISVFRLAGGKIAEAWVEMNDMLMTQQHGALPAPGRG